VTGRDYRLAGLGPEKARVPIVDLPKTHSRWIEPNHHPRIHAQDLRRIDVDSFHMRDASAGLAMMKG
jgi:hypothetical protein